MSDDNEEDGCLAIIIQCIVSMGQSLFERVIAPFILIPLATLLHIKKLYAGLIVTGLATALFTGIAKFMPTKDNDKVEKEEQYERKVDNNLAILPGIYSVSVYYDNKKLDSKTAEIKFYKENEYKLVFVGEYAPEFINITVNSQRKLVSNQIGEGVITYKKELDKTTIIFKKDKYQWTLIK